MVRVTWSWTVDIAEKSDDEIIAYAFLLREFAFAGLVCRYTLKESILGA